MTCQTRVNSSNSCKHQPAQTYPLFIQVHDTVSSKYSTNITADRVVIVIIVYSDSTRGRHYGLMLRGTQITNSNSKPCQYERTLCSSRTRTKPFRIFNINGNKFRGVIDIAVYLDSASSWDYELTLHPAHPNNMFKNKYRYTPMDTYELVARNQHNTIPYIQRSSQTQSHHRQYRLFGQQIRVR